MERFHTCSLVVGVGGKTPSVDSTDCIDLVASWNWFWLLLLLLDSLENDR